jgi:hypothetical protein
MTNMFLIIKLNTLYFILKILIKFNMLIFINAYFDHITPFYSILKLL